MISALEVVDHQSASRKLQDGLPLGLPVFHRCAFRLLGNAADAEDEGLRGLLGVLPKSGERKAFMQPKVMTLSPGSAG